MSPEVKRIAEPKAIDNYMRKLFSVKPVYLKTKELNIETGSFIYKDDQVTFEVPDTVSEKNINLYIRNGAELFIARATITSRSGPGYNCKVNEILIMNLPRKEERISPAEIKAGAELYISNIISDVTLKQNFEDNKRRMGALKNDIEIKLGKKYDKVKIYSVSEQKYDARMTYFIMERKPYFIKNTTERSDDEQYRYYIEFIYASDRDTDRSIISEIAVPLLYRYMLPFGYMQVNSRKPLSDEDFSFIKKQGMSISTFFTNDKTFIKSSDDRISIVDLSMTGLGIIFRERSLIRHFKEGNFLIFTVFLPDKKTTTVMCQVKNINVFKNGSYKVGCSVLNFDAIGEVNYTEYLESISGNG